MTIFQIGSLVKARGREWVVQPQSDDDWLILRPLGGTEAETAGLFLPLEGHDVQAATFDPPDPARPGDFIFGRLLRDAVRLGFRSSAGPFRSFGRIAVEPRPYQLVPLLMALKLDPLRLLIADDVGIGKTVEAGLIARELLDRGEVQRLAVLYPPYVMHYDLSWNPTRHEQREGRVDRYGQPAATVRAITYYGRDNQIDGVVLEVLLRKHKAIRSSLGISVPVPAGSEEVVQALMQGLLLRGGQNVDSRQLRLEFAGEPTDELYLAWENATEREKQLRTMFAQRTIKVDEVAREWQAMQEAIGAGADVRRFMQQAVTAHGGFVQPAGAAWRFHLPNKAAVKEAVLGVGAADHDTFTARFELPVADGVLYLSRTHPYVEGMANYVMTAALDPLLDGVAQRCGATRTKAVQMMTTLLLLRFRFHVETTRRGAESTPLLAEDVRVAGFRGSPSNPEWLSEDEAEQLLLAQPDANVNPQQATTFLKRVTDNLEVLQEALNGMAEEQAQELLEAHKRVREAGRVTGVSHSVRPQLPVDILGVYALLPAG